MSKPRYYWSSHVEKTLRRYPKKLEEDDSLQATIALVAIKKAIDETLLLPDGERIIQLIKMIYFENRYTIDGAASKLYISTSTAKKWKGKFVYLVGEKMGWL